MIIYIHGFGGSGQGSKARVLRDMLKPYGFIAPSLSTIPELAISTLSELIETFQKYEPVYLIGSSLGGYYSLYLSEKYHLRAALINPAVYAYTTLENSIGTVPNFYDLSGYEWRETHLQMLRDIETANADQAKLLLLLQTGDEVLDYREALAKLPNAETIVEEGGEHGFTGIERYADAILDFFFGETRT